MEVGRSSYAVPDDITSSRSSVLDLKVSRDHWNACLELARISYGLLTSRITVFPETFAERCEKAWRGRIFQGVRLATYADLFAALEAYFGTMYLRWCRAFPDKRSGKLAVRNRGKSFSAFWIVLLATACTAIKECPFDESSSMRFWFERGVRSSQPAVYCVNRFASHGPNHVVNRVFWNGGLYHARCSCGMKFVFHRYEGRTPLEVRVTEYGLETLAYLRQLLARGMTHSGIAKATGTTPRWVQGYLWNRRHTLT